MRTARRFDDPYMQTTAPSRMAGTNIQMVDMW